MKKTVILMSLLMLMGSVRAQTLSSFDTDMSVTPRDRMTFKNIPITGHLSDFVDKLVAEGFTVDSRKDNLAQLSGRFAGNESEIYVFATPVTKTVYKVTVYQPKETSWYTIKSNYFTVKNQFTQKYGKPKSEYEFFSDPYYEGDGYEMTALKVEKCHYASFWDLKEGDIAVIISKFSQISLSYEDGVNSELYTREKEAGVMEDI